MTPRNTIRVERPIPDDVRPAPLWAAYLSVLFWLEALAYLAGAAMAIGGTYLTVTTIVEALACASC